jgi:hypothetical protein
MNSTFIKILGHVSERPLAPCGIAQPAAGKTRTACRKCEPEARLWKLTSTAISPVKQGFETSLFLIASSFGIGAMVYGMGQLVAFVHSDSLEHTITALLR